MSSELGTIDFLNKGTGLMILHQNIRSMRSNFDSFLTELAALDYIPKILILSEIWIKESEVNLYQIPDYILHIKTNENYKAGGIAIFIHSTVDHSQFSFANFVSADVIEVTFTASDSEFLLIAIYKLHNFSSILFMDELNMYLSNKSINSFKNILIMGDMNINLLENNNLTDEYKIILANNGLHSLINSPTRITERTETCIDHVIVKISNINKILIDAVVIDNNVTDHCMTAVWVRSGGGVADYNALKVNNTSAYRINFDTLDNLLDNADWNDVYLQSDASLAFDVFYNKLNSYISKSKEEIRVNKKRIIKIKPWINLDTCKRIKVRNELYRKVRNHPNNNALRKYFKLSETSSISIYEH